MNFDGFWTYFLKNQNNKIPIIFDVLTQIK